MSKELMQEESGVLDVYDTEISDDDYGFIIGPDGELKSIFTPENAPDEPPESVVKILKMFGIKDINHVNTPTLH